ncbi:gamma subclass chorismate mutase AroQ [Pseudonocardia benzenivorans]
MPAHAPRRRLLAGPLLVCALAVLAALAPTAGPAVRTVGDSTADSGVDPLLDLIVTRIETGDVVARAKWASRGPVEDPAREQVVLDAARAGATGRGLDPDVVAAVFADQIAASKVVQYGLFSDWTAEPAAAPPPAPTSRPSGPSSTGSPPGCSTSSPRPPTVATAPRAAGPCRTPPGTPPSGPGSTSCTAPLWPAPSAPSAPDPGRVPVAGTRTRHTVFA